jgi:hypothetical protein
MPTTEQPDSGAEIPEPSLEVQRFEFDKARAMRDESREELRSRAEKTSRFWVRFAILLPVLTAMVGYFVQSDMARKNAQVRFIDRQLSEFYYPVQLRLRKDDELFVFWEKNQNIKANRLVLNEVRNGVILSNNQEVISILEKHSDLLRNPDEHTDIQFLMASLILYERHVALLSALHRIGDKRTPWNVDQDWRYPNDFERDIDIRVHQLEEQRRNLKARWL